MLKIIASLWLYNDTAIVKHIQDTILMYLRSLKLNVSVICLSCTGIAITARVMSLTARLHTRTLVNVTIFLSRDTTAMVEMFPTTENNNNKDIKMMKNIMRGSILMVPRMVLRMSVQS